MEVIYEKRKNNNDLTTIMKRIEKIIILVRYLQERGQILITDQYYTQLERKANSKSVFERDNIQYIKFIIEGNIEIELAKTPTEGIYILTKMVSSKRSYEIGEFDDSKDYIIIDYT